MNKSLAATFFERAELLSEREAVRYKENKSPYKSMTWTALARLVKEMAAGLTARGVEGGDRVAILSQTSHLWAAADLATISSGGVSVPIYPTSSQSDIDFILSNSGAKVVFVHGEQLLKKVLASKQEALTTVVLVSQLNKGRSLSEFLTEQAISPDFVIGLEELRQLGLSELEKNPALVFERMEKIHCEDMATIIYTSGTTGTPKGVPLTHGNIVSVLDELKDVIPINENDVYLSYLPMSHVFERVCGEYYWIYSGGVCAYAEGIETMAKNMAEVKPTMILTVPRVLDKIYGKVRSGIEGASGNARKLIDWALRVGAEMVDAEAKGIAPRAGLKAKHWLAERTVFRKLRERLGPSLRLIVSGGAPATSHSIEFFNAIGITTIEGYGLTETAAPACVNLMNRKKIGTVGPALPCVEMIIADDGEILLRGSSIFKGYYGLEEATREAFIDGWFRTGDIGIVDGDGYLKITDRKKDIIVNSSGKNIAPQKIEAILKTVPFVNQAVVFGDKRKQLIALIVLDEQAITQHASDEGWNFNSFADLVEKPEVVNMLKKEIDARSKSLADYERVSNFHVLADDLSVEAGELTATLKIKRNVVANNYKSIIDRLYKEEKVEKTQQAAHGQSGKGLVGTSR
ncbi:MAG: long-chain fatty acid--CoA ligase [Candidatus Melainabacteria bacterium]|nr:long-chain fatty acid--CoA ligase [Candidatus Melainabacteria bacterium]